MRNTDDVSFMGAERLVSCLSRATASSPRPFHPPSVTERLQRSVAAYLAAAIETAVGQELYVKRDILELEDIPSRFSVCMRHLMEEGIVRRYVRLRPVPGWPRICTFFLELSGGVSASGFALDEERATTKAFGEAFERHAYVAPPARLFATGSWKELVSAGAVNPAAFGPFSADQLERDEYAPHRFTEDSPFGWTEAETLHDGRACLVPAQLVYRNHAMQSGEPLIQLSTSSGCAAGSTPEMAAHNAICELIERDALMIHWLNRLSPPRIDTASYRNTEIDSLVAQYARHGIEFAVLDITTDLGIPTVMAALRGRVKGRPVLYLSPRTDLDIEAAIVAALGDALRAGFVGDVSDLERESVNQEYPHLDSREDRRRYWTDPGRYAEADFLFNAGPTGAPVNAFKGAPLRAKMSRIRQALREQGFHCYLADMTTDVARRFGLTIRRALIPGLYPLYFNEQKKYLGIRRLFEAPVRMGVSKIPNSVSELNPVPHPML